jgi:hypothetical protein
MKLSYLSENSCQSEELLDSLGVSHARAKAVETTSVGTSQDAPDIPCIACVANEEVI